MSDIFQEKIIGLWMLPYAKLMYNVFGRLCSSTNTQTMQFEEITRPLTEWNGQFFAPAVEKVMDGIILYELIREFQPKGAALAEAVNRARFEEIALSGLIQKGLPIDVLDLGIQFDFDIGALRAKKWIRDIYVRSFDEPPTPAVLYSAIICNNGYAVSENLGKTLKQQKGSLKKDGYLFFNMHLPCYSEDAYRIFKLLSILSRDREAFMQYDNAEKGRLKGSLQEKEVDSVISAAGFKIIKKVYYLRGIYQFLSSFLLYPIYMKYFDIMKLEPERWTPELRSKIEDFKRWFPRCAARFAPTQFKTKEDHQNGGSKLARKIYYVLQFK